MTFIEPDYLKNLDRRLSSSSTKKSVFIAKGAYAKLFEIGKKFGCFTWLPAPEKFDLNHLYIINIHEMLRVHVITHFPASISDKHIAEIRNCIATAG